MKFQNYILTVAICSLFACSNEDDPVKTTVIEPDAILSLMVENEDASTLKSTKADPSDFENLDKNINTLTLAVFNQGAYEDKELGLLVALKTVKNTNGGSIEGLAVHSGPVDVLVFGNLPEQVLTLNSTKLSDITGGVLSAGLKDEETQLTMGSAVHRVIIQSEKVNCMGYSDKYITEHNNSASAEGKDGYVSLYQSDKTQPGIKLYRNVARIQLKSITLAPLKEYSENADFTLTSLFVANVKSKTRLTSAEEWGRVEYTTPSGNAADFWLCGAFAEEEGALKIGQATEYDNLFIQLREPGVAESIEHKDLVVHLSGNETYSAEKRKGGVIGKTFYVYENADEQTNHTLLVLCGTYKYTPEDQDTPVTVNGFYAVTVNKPGEGHLSEGMSGEWTPYIKRNFNYSVNVTVKTPGSKKSYDPEINAYLSAAVKVEPWHVKDIHEDVE